MAGQFSEYNMRRWGFLLNGILWYIASRLDLQDLEALLAYVVHHYLYPVHPPHMWADAMFSTEHRHLMLSCERDQIPDPVHNIMDFSVQPPNRIVCLSHWRILANLLERLPQADRDEAVEVEDPLHRSGLPQVDPRLLIDLTAGQPITFIDAHFHLDLLLNRTRSRTLRAIEVEVADPQFVLEAGVANYVFPHSLSRLPEEATQDLRIWFTVGVHPLFVREIQDIESLRQDLRRWLRHPRCVGLGEVGLEYPGDHVDLQKRVLRALLPLAEEYDATLVLHCRGPGAESDVLTMLQNLHLTHLRIHFHCFTGDLTVAQTWMSDCPNVCFGFTSLVSSKDNRQLEQVVSRLPGDRIVLETDSPYLGPSRWSRTPNHPWTLPNTAGTVAMYRNLPLPLLLQTANDNARRLYRF
jgi:TatD DNase family protein